jgi:hypothetical protein
MAAVTPRDAYEIARLQTFLALRGDTLAAQFIFDRTIGRPGTVAETALLDAMDNNDGNSSRPTGMLEEELRRMLDSVPLVPLALAAPESHESPEAEESSPDAQDTKAAG